MIANSVNENVFTKMLACFQHSKKYSSKFFSFLRYNIQARVFRENQEGQRQNKYMYLHFQIYIYINIQQKRGWYPLASFLIFLLLIAVV